MAVCLVLGALSLLIWVGIALHPARPWAFRPVGEDEAAPAEPARWPSVRILVPARNEAQTLPETLPSLLHQDYPGRFGVTLVDDRSEDGTARLAEEIAARAGAKERLRVVSGSELPHGWVGKMWALQQGVEACGFGASAAGNTPKYVLLTDADIRHAPHSLRRLVAESEAARLALNSRMARLHCTALAERLLVPPFVFFFGLLYPMRRVNAPAKRPAAAAGGCLLLTAQALVRMDGFRAVRDRVIDDVSIAKLVKAAGLSIRLSLSRTDVESLRTYERPAGLWRMVRRSAFTQLGYSWTLLSLTLIGMAVAFAAPPVLLGIGAGTLGTDVAAGVPVWQSSAAWLTLTAGLAWGLMAALYLPAVRFFGLARGWALTLPIAAALYQAMTLDSAFRHVTTGRVDWR